MTNVQIFKQDNNILGYVVSGHSGYAEQGSDIICSAISSLAQSTCVGLDNVLNLNPIVKVKQNNAYFSCFLPKTLTQKQFSNAQILLATFEKSVQLLLAGDKNYKKYINLEVKNEIH